MSSKLGLGTVQFGTPYGVANNSGMPPLAEIAGILSAARNHGIELLDTAPAYGQSEVFLGDCLPVSNPMRIVSKTPRLANIDRNPDWIEVFRASLKLSLARLQQESIYCLLLHNVAEIPADMMSVVAGALTRLRAEGLVEKVGASIYDDEEVRQVSDWADVVQLPLNVFSQVHWRNGNLNYLRQYGVEIHVRSVLLQGLVTVPPNQLKACFLPAKEALQRFHSACTKASVSPLQASVAFACGNPLVDYVIVGVERTEQLAPLVRASETDISGFDFEAFDGTLGALADTRSWPLAN